MHPLRPPAEADAASAGASSQAGRSGRTTVCGGAAVQCGPEHYLALGITYGRLATRRSSPLGGAAGYSCNALQDSLPIGPGMCRVHPASRTPRPGYAFHPVGLCRSSAKRCYICAMTEVGNVTEPRLTRPSTQRVRRYRERRREGLRLLTLEIPKSAIDAAVARDFLKPEDSTQAWSVIESVYATQLSDRALTGSPTMR
jgi:hypothetical protein